MTNNFTTIIITMPDHVSNEVERICHYATSGMRIHLRKPAWTKEETEQLLGKLPDEVRRVTVLHDWHELATTYSLGGIHLNKRNNLIPPDFDHKRMTLSGSCHSLDELIEWKEKCDYVSLSPIFDSISKQGYYSSFSTDDITLAAEKGIIDRKVFALGGVTFKKLDEIKEMGFGGAMILGDAWR